MIDQQLRVAVENFLKAGVFTRYSLAQRANVDYNTVRNWLNGKYDLKLHTAAKIARVLNMNLAFVEWTGPPLPPVVRKKRRPKRL